MSEWWLLVAVFWFWYFADCVKLGRKARFLLSSPLGAGRASVREGTVAITPLLPAAWLAWSEDAPFCFSPDGLANVPVGSAGRPGPVPQRPQVWTWEEITQIAEARGWLYVNGQSFCPVTPFTTAAELRKLIDGCKGRPREERERWLRLRVALWFRVAHLRRRRAVMLGRTAGLAVLASVAFVLAALVSSYLLLSPLLALSHEMSDRIARFLPVLGWQLLGLHLIIVACGWWAHRRLMPARTEMRFSVVFSALLLPPQAYRLRVRVCAEDAELAHPLAWMIATAKPAHWGPYATNVIADLRWPVPLRCAENGRDILLQQVSSWARAACFEQVSRVLGDGGLTVEQLLQPPQPDSAESCLYCPRCNSQFTSTAGSCPHGIKLLPIR